MNKLNDLPTNKFIYSLSENNDYNNDKLKKVIIILAELYIFYIKILYINA